MAAKDRRRKVIPIIPEGRRASLLWRDWVPIRLAEPLGANRFMGEYSIHDLSRCRGEGDANLARFNMPLELGMAIAFRELRPEAHDWLALIPEGFEYRHYVSDLGGFDPEKHDGPPQDVTVQVVRRLGDRWGKRYHRRVRCLLSTFEATMESLRAESST